MLTDMKLQVETAVKDGCKVTLSFETQQYLPASLLEASAASIIDVHEIWSSLLKWALVPRCVEQGSGRMRNLLAYIPIPVGRVAQSV